MLTLISPENRDSYKNELIELYKLRYQVFCVNMKWNLPAINEMEIDQFDHEHTYYLIYRFTPTSPIFASIRITPTTSPNLTTDIFGNLISQKQFLEPRSDCWEISRFALNPTADRGKKISNFHLGTLIISWGLLEFGLSKNIKNYITFTMPHIERILNLLGWPFQRIGNQTLLDEVNTISGVLNVNKDCYERLSRKLVEFNTINMFSDTNLQRAI